MRNRRIRKLQILWERDRAGRGLYHPRFLCRHHQSDQEDSHRASAKARRSANGLRQDSAEVCGRLPCLGQQTPAEWRRVLGRCPTVGTVYRLGLQAAGTRTMQAGIRTLRHLPHGIISSSRRSLAPSFK